LHSENELLSEKLKEQAYEIMKLNEFIITTQAEKEN
jgi:hypothetical protein